MFLLLRLNEAHMQSKHRCYGNGLSCDVMHHGTRIAVRGWRCAVVQLQMYTAEKDVITSKIWFTKLCLYYLDTQKTHFLRRTNISCANETVTPKLADCWDTPGNCQITWTFDAGELLNCGHLMIRLLDLVKQECAAIARLGNLESKPRYSYRPTNDIHGTGPSLKCRLSVSQSNTRLSHSTVHHGQYHVTSQCSEWH